MKRAVLILAICFLPGLTGAAALVDDFDSYELGAVGTVTENWEGTANVTIAVNPDDAADQVIQTTEGGGAGQQSSYCILSSEATIANNTTCTMFLRFKATAAIDSSIGLTDVDVPLLGGSDWGNFRAQVAVVNGTIRARDGGSTRTLAWASTGTQVALNTNWYNLWVVVDNAADTIKLYLNQNGDGGATESDLLVNVATLTQSTFAFRTSTTEALDRFYWRAQNNAVDRILRVDDIYIMNGTDLTNPAGIFGAHIPTPANGATNVALNTMLSWYTGVDPANPANPNPNITKHYVYMRANDPNMAYAPHTAFAEIPATGATDDCNPLTDLGITLVEDNTYYWRVDESVNDSGPSEPNTIRGSTWRFDVIKTFPVINRHPINVVVAEGQTAVFSVTATSVSTATYYWYKSVDAANNTEGDDTLKLSGVDANSLTINPVAVADEGYYYCKVVNQSGEANAARSNVAMLGVKRAVAHWTLDGLDVNSKYADSIGGHDADPNGNPTFVTGAGTGTNNGVIIDAANGYATADTWNPSQYTGQFTLSLWAKWAGQTTPTTWQGLFSKETSYGAGNMMWQIEVVNAAAASSTVMLKNGMETGNLTTNPLPIDVWEHVVVTFDWTTATIYRNGVNAASGGWSMGSKTDAPLNIGISARSLTENLMFNGALDDIQIWNYALTQNQVIDLYHAVSGQGVCTNKPTYDFDDDCLVTLSDFVLMASEWLRNGLYPQP